MSVSTASDIILKKFFQNPVSFEHGQKVWARSEGTKASVVPGKNFANLALLKCLLCSTLYCVKLRRAQDEE